MDEVIFALARGNAALSHADRVCYCLTGIFPSVVVAHEHTRTSTRCWTRRRPTGSEQRIVPRYCRSARGRLREG